MNSKVRILGLVGERGSGKTPLIMDILQGLQGKGLRLAGLISPGIFEGKKKVAIELIDLTSRERRLLAKLSAEKEGALGFGDWSFFEATIAWGNEKLTNLPPCDLLVLDEIGPLELDLGQGLQQGLARLAERDYRLALISLRPRCAESIQRLMPEIELFELGLLDAYLIKKIVLRIVVVQKPFDPAKTSS